MSDIKDKSIKENTSPDFLLFVAQKLEKIAHALYLVTNLFPADEPLRASLRKTGIGLVGSAESIRHSSPRDASFSSPNLSDTIRELVSLLALARTCGLISEMNHSVLKEECENLVSLGDSPDIYAGPLLGEEDFKTENLPERALKTPENRPEIAKKSSFSLEKEQGESTQTTAKNTPKKSKATSAKKERRKSILLSIKERGESNIKDIAKDVNGCSTKTIQRELGTLVDRGLVHKEGERRWSTYILTKSGRESLASNA